MNKFTNEIKIGAIVLIAIVVAFIGFRIMQDEPLLSSVNLVKTKYASIDGLLRGSSVFLNGFKVGSVREMEYIPEEDSIVVVLSIKEPISIPVGSKALLASPDFIGSATIKLLKSENTEIIEWGTFIKGTKKESLVNSFADRGSAITDSVEITLELVNEMLRSVNDLENGTTSNIKSMVSNFKETSESIRSVITSRQQEVDSMIVAANRTMTNLSTLTDSSSEDLQSMIANLEAFSSDLDSLSINLQSSTNSLNSILEKMDTGEGSLSKMLNDPSLYNNIDSLTINLNELIKGIQADPKKYLKHMRLVEIF